MVLVQAVSAFCADRHHDDVRHQQKIASEVTGSLDAQVAAVRERQLAEAQQEALEVQRMQQHWAQLEVRSVHDAWDVLATVLQQRCSRLCSVHCEHSAKDDALLWLVQAEANAAEAAERQRLQALAEEVKQFNELKLLQLTEQERQER